MSRCRAVSLGRWRIRSASHSQRALGSAPDVPITVNDPANCHSPYSTKSSELFQATSPSRAHEAERPVTGPVAVPLVRPARLPTLIAAATMNRPHEAASAYCHGSIRCGTAEPPYRQPITGKDPQDDH